VNECGKSRPCRPALSIAVENQDESMFLMLIAAGADLNTAQLLLNHNADVDAPSSKLNGRTALEAAAENGRLDTVQLLLNPREPQSRVLDRPQFERARQYGSHNGHLEVVEMLRDYEAQHVQNGHVEEQVGDI
jgi:ankyrin repeat protein